jgi:large subunit ribosomal protein L19e
LNLRSQRRLASEILGSGRGRVKIEPDRIEDVDIAITRDEIRRLVNEGAIQLVQKKGVSRGRCRVVQNQKKKGRRKGVGTRRGSSGARSPKKSLWIRKIRALRRRLSDLRDRNALPPRAYRRLYLMAKGGAFRNVSHMDQYIETHGLKIR